MYQYIDFMITYEALNFNVAKMNGQDRITKDLLNW